jgi:chromosome segregation ATPase
MRREIADLEQELRNELQRSATLLKDQLAVAVMDLENLRLRTTQVLDRHVEDASKGFADVAKKLIEHVANAGDTYRSASEALAQNAAQVASEIGRLVDRVDQIQVPPDLVTRQVEEARTRIATLADALEQATASGGQQVEHTATQVQSIASSLEKLAASGAARQEELAQTARTLDEFIRRASQVSVFDNMEASVTRFGQGIEAAVERLSTANERVGRYIDSIGQAASQLAENGNAAAHAKTSITEDLKQSTEALHKLQGTLADVADALVARVSHPPTAVVVTRAPALAQVEQA